MFDRVRYSRLFLESIASKIEDLMRKRNEGIHDENGRCPDQSCHS